MKRKKSGGFEIEFFDFFSKADECKKSEKMSSFRG